MGSTNIPAPVKWKYGLKLITCPVCIDEGKIPYNCHQCNDMGEYWVATMKDGSQKIIQIGNLDGLMQRLMTERFTQVLDNVVDSR